METRGNSDLDVTLIDTHTDDEVDRLSGVEYFFTFLEKVVVCCEPKPYWNDISQDTEKPATAITHMLTQNSAPPPSWTHIYRPMEYYTVKVKAEIIGDGESFEQIAQMEATCKMCYQFLKEEISVLKTKCKCKLSLVHEKCYTKKQNEDKCDVCSEIIEYIPVTLSKPDNKPVDLVIDIGGPENLQLSESSKRSETWFSKLFGHRNR